MATIHTFVADIVDRIPAMANDGPENNRRMLENLTREFLDGISEQEKTKRLEIIGKNMDAILSGIKRKNSS